MSEQALAQRYAESPLTTLVRRASSRRVVPQKPSLRQQNSSDSQHPPPSFVLQTPDEEQYHGDPLVPPGGGGGPFRGHVQDPNYTPPSPLLHGHFGRDSIATTSSYDRDSYLPSSRRIDSYNSATGSAAVFHDRYYNPDSPSSSSPYSYPGNGQDDNEDGGYNYEDAYEQSAYEESVYSQTDSAIRDSWDSTATARQLDNDAPSKYHQQQRYGTTATTNTTPGAMQLDESQRMQWDNQSLRSVVPSVFVSPETEAAYQEAEPMPKQSAGRAKITAPVSGNFSRPLHSSSQPQPHSKPQIHGPPPPVHNLSEEQKRQVLLRNAGKRGRPEATTTAAGTGPSPLRHQYSSDSTTTAHKQGGGGSGASGRSPSPMANGHLGPYQANTQKHQASSHSLAPPPLKHHNSSSSSRSRSLSPSPSQSQSRSPSPSHQSNMPHSNATATHQQQHSNRPGILKNSSNSSNQPRSHSPATSVYSNYSYYQFEQAADSPTGSTFSNSADPFAAASRPPLGHNPKSGLSQSSSNHLQPPGTSSSRSASPTNSSPDAPKTAHDYLLLGIDHHEHDRLSLSASCFEKSAKVDGGCGVGMLMWGLTLRHGWGCEKNEKSAFNWLQKAAENAVGDLERTREMQGGGGKGGVAEMGAVKSELILAVYEVGQCFFQGWGVKKDQKMAISYYTIAAELGDADAQMDLAFCLANGKGCKKDKSAAAKWYRAAVKQGQSDVGLAWIYKEKYQ